MHVYEAVPPRISRGSIDAESRCESLRNRPPRPMDGAASGPVPASLLRRMCIVLREAR